MEQLYLKDSRSVVDDYFKSWHNHDVTLLQKIFSDDALYIILSNPVKIFNGISSISEYWIKNKRRQDNLSIHYELINIINGKIEVDFSALFYDSDDRESQQIKGWIQFYIFEKKIEILKEKYIKIVK